ncbi:chorismate--pyruvate lyase family protein [Zobellella maritima]|uniref:chorismate--pyruvate lyase family protein n=1 Tax=Zobellella maritima TaxID=2059725 RepID=UPI001E5DE5B0|nr:chorismate lyase [Zobellella maritima]
MTIRADQEWHWLTGPVPPELSPLLTDWLYERGSMTERLRRHCRDFRVEVRAQADEMELEPALAERLGSTRAFCREVLLYCDDVPWIYASSLYSRASLDACPALAGLGQKALGELLFEQPGLARSQFEFAGLGPEQQAALARRIGLPLAADFLLWGRRSTLRAGGAQVLVTELFLPRARAYQEQYS